MMIKMNNLSKSLIFFVLLAMFLGGATVAGIITTTSDWGVITGVRPIFQLDFNDEPDDVYLTGFNLTNSSGGNVDYFANPPETQPSRIYTFGPKDSSERCRPKAKHSRPLEHSRHTESGSQLAGL